MSQISEPYSPVIDGQLLDEQPFFLISAGKIRPHTPVVFGSQRDEGEMFSSRFVDKVQTTITYIYIYASYLVYYMVYYASKYNIKTSQLYSIAILYSIVF